MADQRILRGTAATLTWQPTDSVGEPAAPSGAVTVEVTSSDGTEVIAAGTATDGTGTDPRSVALTAAQTADLDELTATWTDGDSEHTTTAEIVGGYYFTVAEARASDEFLADETKVDTATIVRLRAEVEDEIERITNVAFVPRFRRRHLFSGTCSSVLLTPYVRAIRSIASYWGSTFTAWSANDLTALHLDAVVGRVTGYRSFAGDLLVAWEHGMDHPPADVKTAALILMREKATRPWRAVPDRATSYSGDEQGTIDLARPTAWSTGIPDVDAVLDRYSMRVGIA
ncbi:MAG TPA: hypothetical protein VD864_01015 [Nocardioides sp.]|nr:hypothetical protein [Nocardioides sp.]